MNSAETTPRLPAPGEAEANRTQPRDLPNAGTWALLGGAAVAGIALVVIASRLFGDREQRAVGNVDWIRRVVANPSVQASGLKLLRDALVGNDRRGILQILGSPDAAGRDGLYVRRPSPQAQALADTWFYPVDADKTGAVAIEFDGNRVKDAEFYRVPRKGE